MEPNFEDLEPEDLEVSGIYQCGADDQNNDEELGREFEEQIARMKAELEKFTPNLKAMDRFAPYFYQ